jgi:spermidine synthase
MNERLLVLIAYLLSGACGLIYEVVWTRHLSLTFGISVFATSAVLAAFMAGLGLGSYLVGRWIDRSRNPIRVYALLEAGIGLYALIVPWIFLLLEPLYISLHPFPVKPVIGLQAARQLVYVQSLEIPRRHR